jgi:hypothetical protein
MAPTIAQPEARDPSEFPFFAPVDDGLGRLAENLGKLCRSARVPELVQAAEKKARGFS